jgi:ATP-dependent DNA helicase PIF1
VSDPLKLFTEHASHMSEDINYQMNRMSSSANSLSIQNFVTFSLLFELEKLLKDAGYSLSHFNLPIPNHIGTASTKNRLILDELTYAHTLASYVENDVPRLNASQKNVFDAICKSAFNNEGRTFFVYGYGGTGKTFLWTTLLNFIRGQGKIALAVASSGIATLLVPGGRTPHSCFKISLEIKENSMCNVKKNTHLSELIIQTSLIIWDEAPVNHRYCFEALDRTLRDILSDTIPDAQNRQFGGKIVVLGGDFRQTLHVIQNSSKQQILKACIVNSYLWRNCDVLQLNESMRLNSTSLSPSDREQLRIFAEWLLRVGSEIEPSVQINADRGKYIKIPESLLLPQEHRHLDGLVSFVYNHGCEPENPSSYFSNRAILCPTNDVVATINSKMIEQLTPAQMSYYSSDCIDDSTGNHSTMEALYPTEFLNTLSINGLPDHVLHLKIGVPIMLLCNLDPTRGLCNGTRLIVTQLTSRIIEAKIITGKAKGTRAYIPRIVTTSAETKWPFKLRRRQFPIKLSYAMTINKSQGQTLNTVSVFLSSPVFSHGQLYVALSRVTSLKGLRVLIQNSPPPFDEYTPNVVYDEVFSQITGVTN